LQRKAELSGSMYFVLKQVHSFIPLAYKWQTSLTCWTEAIFPVHVKMELSLCWFSDDLVYVSIFLVQRLILCSWMYARV
jgi:hypothetical protein